MKGRHLFATVLAGLLFSLPVQATIITLQADLNGANEVPPGDPDGTGFATFTIDTIAMTVVWEITVDGIDDVVAAHIHIGDSATNGDVRIDFAGELSGSTTDEDAALVAANPSGWYVNVHTAEFPNGAVRGQLHRVAGVTEPGSAGLMLLGLIGVAWLRRRA